MANGSRDARGAEFPAILKRKLSVKVISGSGDEIEATINEWLTESQSEDTLVGAPKHEIAPDGTHYAIFYFVEG